MGCKNWSDYIYMVCYPYWISRLFRLTTVVLVSEEVMYNNIIISNLSLFSSVSMLVCLKSNLKSWILSTSSNRIDLKFGICSKSDDILMVQIGPSLQEGASQRLCHPFKMFYSLIWSLIDNTNKVNKKQSAKKFVSSCVLCKCVCCVVVSSLSIGKFNQSSLSVQYGDTSFCYE